MMSDAKVYKLDIVMLEEYCRLAGLDCDETTQRLLDSNYTMGGQEGEHTIILAARLARWLGVEMPSSLNDRVYVVVS